MLRKACAAALLLMAGGVVATEQRTTGQEAEALVRKAASQVAMDRERALREISDPAGPYTMRDMYVVVYSMDGTSLAHGANRRLVGKNMLDFRDQDGKEFLRERIDMSRSQSRFWHTFKGVDPATRRFETKQVYCETVGRDLLVCGGG